MTVQVNVRLQETLHKRIKKDALEHGVSLEDYARHCFEEFLGQAIADRRQRLSRADRKTLGRKIKL